MFLNTDFITASPNTVLLLCILDSAPVYSSVASNTPVNKSRYAYVHPYIFRRHTKLTKAPWILVYLVSLSSPSGWRAATFPKRMSKDQSVLGLSYVKPLGHNSSRLILFRDHIVG